MTLFRGWAHGETHQEDSNRDHFHSKYLLRISSFIHSILQQNRSLFICHISHKFLQKLLMAGGYFFLLQYDLQLFVQLLYKLSAHPDYTLTGTSFIFYRTILLGNNVAGGGGEIEYKCSIFRGLPLQNNYVAMVMS